MRLTTIATIAALAAGPAFAVQKPQGSPADKRVQTVTYDPDNVIEIPIVPGVVTHIVFDPDEQVVDYLLGDAKAVAHFPKANHLWVKPAAEPGMTPGDSNLSIATDRRNYSFHLRYTRSVSQAVYQVVIKYPDIEARKLRERALASTVEAGMGQQSVPDNTAYTRTEDSGISLVAARDDGVRTFFTFRGEVPVIAAVDATGNPYNVARTMQGTDTAVVHTVAQRWIMRLSKGVVLGVVNEAYESGRASTSTGTVSPAVQRVLKDEVR